MILPKKIKPAKERYVPGSRWRKTLAKRQNFSLEELEPRYLLDANLYDTSGSPDPAIKTAIQSNLTATFDRLATLGNTLSADTKAAETPIPFVQQSLNDLLGYKLGDFLVGGTGNDAYTEVIRDFYGAGLVGGGGAVDLTPTAAELASRLDSAVKAKFGSGASVSAANSTSGQLVLDFDIDLTGTAAATALKFGDEAQEFSLDLGNGATINLGTSRSVNFSIKADLSTFTAGALADTTKYSVQFGGTQGGGEANEYKITGTANHTTTVNQLSGFGVGFGLIGARDAVGQAGAYIDSASSTFSLNLDVRTGFNTGGDNLFTLFDLNAYNTTNTWTSAFTVDTSTGTNNAAATFQLLVANPAGDTFISGLGGLTGGFTFTDSNLFDKRSPLVKASDPTIASLSRMNTSDLLQYLRNTANVLGQTASLEEMQSLLPFLDLSLGDAYAFQEAVEAALVKPLTLVENVLTAKNAPATSGDPLNYSGTTQFKIYIVQNGVLLNSSGTNINLSADSNRDTLGELAAALTTALPTIGGSKLVQARVTGTASPRIELYAADGVEFYLESINIGGQTLDLGFEKYGLVYVRNNGTINGTGSGKYQVAGVSKASASAITLTTLTSPLVFTVQRGSAAAVTVSVPEGNYASVAAFTAAVQTALAGAGLYNVATGDGVRVQTNVAGSGYGVKFTDTTGGSLTLAGTNVSFFHLGSLTGTTLTSTTPVVLSTFDTAYPITITVKKQDGGILTTETATFNIPAGNYGSNAALVEALKSALQTAGLLDYAGSSGVLVQGTTVGNGFGVEFYGSAEVYEITLSGTGLAKLNITAGTSTAASINIRVTANGAGSPTTSLVYLNGNTTKDYFGQPANTTVDDFVADMQAALIRAGLLADDGSTGVDFRALPNSAGNLTDTVEFFARNPGTGTGKIQFVGTASNSGLSNINMNSLDGSKLAISVAKETPAFANIQEFVSMLRNAIGVPVVKVGTTASGGLDFSAWTGNTTSILISGGGLANLGLQAGTNGTAHVYSSGSVDLTSFNTSPASSRQLTFTTTMGTKTITLPKQDFGSIRELADTISSLLREAGLVEGLLETTPTYSGGNLSSGVSPSFSFPMRLFVDGEFDGEALQDLTGVDLRFADSYGSIATGRITNLESTATQTVSRSTDLRFTLGLDLIQPSTEAESLRAELPVLIVDWDGVLEYDAKIRVMLDDGIQRDLIVTAAETSSNTSTQDFVDLLQAKINAISGLSAKLSVSLDTVNNFSRDVIVFTTAPGKSRSLLVTVPESASNETLFANSAAGKLGFATNSNPSALTELYLFAGADNQTLTVTGPTQPFTSGTGYVLADDMYIQVVLPNGTSTVYRIPASSTTTNTTLANLNSDINTVLGAGAGITATSSGGNLAFALNTPGTGTGTWQVRLGKNLYLGSGTTPIIADTAVNSSGGYVLATDAFFTFQLPDGNLTTVQVEKANTTDNLSLADLVADINVAILSKESLTDGIQAKIEAYVDSAAADNKIRFRLSTNFFPTGGNWNLEVASQYTELHSNGAYYDLGMPAVTSVESQLAVQGVMSGPLSDTTGYNLSHALSFQVSINGSSYATVTVAAGSHSTIGSLLGAINTQLAATTIVVGGTSYNVGQFVKAITLEQGTRIQLVLRDDVASTLPDILNARFVPATTTNNGYIDLGFPTEEMRIGIRGSDATLSNIFLRGRAEILNSSFAGTASFGYADFKFGSSDFDLVADTELQISGVTRMQDLMRAFGSYRNEYSALDVTLGIEDDTAASLRLNALSFPPDPATGLSVSGLAFGALPSIHIAYQPKGAAASSSIGAGLSDFDNLPAPDITFTNTNGMEKLSRLSFDDVVNSLWRVGDFLSDWMNNDPNGPFKSKLFFANSGLVDIYDFGLQFNKVIDQLWVNPPTSLQEIQRALASGLQLDESDISVTIVTSGSGNTFQASLRIAFDLVRTVTETLPLYVDIAALADRSTNSGLVKQSLLGLSALASNPTNPLEVEFSALSKLKLDLSVVLVRDGVVIEPEPVLNQPSSGTFFETKFFLNGDSYTGDLPAGANRLRLGYSWTNDQGKEVLAPGDVNTPINVRVASTVNIAGTYAPLTQFSTLTASAVGSILIDGIALSVGDTVLIKNQTDPLQNGIYQVTNAGSGSTAWVLTRTSDDLQWLKVSVNSGALNSGLTFMVKDLPTVSVTAATTAALAGTYTDYLLDGDPSNDHFLPLFTLGSNGALVVDGATLTAGNYVLLKNQATAAQNGVYQVFEAGTTSTPAKLVQMQIGEATRGKAVVTAGSANINKTFYVKNNVITQKTGTADPREVVQLRPAAVAVNATGEVALPDVYGTPQIYDQQEVISDATLTPDVIVRVSTTSALSTIFSTVSNTLTATSNGAITIDGVTLALNDLVLVNHQTDGSQNGIYKVTKIGNGGQGYELTREGAYDTVSEIANIRVKVSQGTYANNEFVQTAVINEFNASVIRFSKLIDPAVFRLNLSVRPDIYGNLQAVGSTAAAAASVLRAATGRLQVNPSTSTTTVLYAASGNSTALTVDGLVLSVGDRVLITQQADRTQNGVYVVTTAGNSWVLTRASDFDSPSELDGARVNITGGTYAGAVFEQINPSVTTLGAFSVDFARVRSAASLASSISKKLAYNVMAATTSAINTTVGTGQVATYDNTNGTLTALANGSINNLSTKAWDFVEGAEITISGIDGVQNLQVGDRILIKDQARTGTNPATAYQGDYQNGIYEIVRLGSSTETWQLKRVDFADSVAEFGELRVSVQRGTNSGNTRFIQTNKTLGAISAGEKIAFSSEVSSVYGHYDVNGTLVQSWTDFSATGEVLASLPLSIVMVPITGGETVLTKNLGSLTDDEKKALGQLGTGIINNDLYESMPDLTPLRITVADDTETVNTGYVGSGLDKYFGTSLIAATFDPLPDLFRSVPPADVLSLLRDWAFMGDALDLALFNLQFGMDLALGISVPMVGSNLPDYTGFIEAFRDNLTTQIRDRIRNDPLKPVNAIRDSLWAALGPNGVGYLTNINQIGINVIGQTWDINDLSNTNYYGTTPEGLKFEKISGTAIEFSFSITRAMDSDANAVTIDTIDIGDDTIGLVINNQTERKNSEGAVVHSVGGVNLRRSFEMNFGFGMDVVDGFYIFNPTQTSNTATPTKDMVKVGIQAELDGDIYTPGVQAFVQAGYYSQLNQLSVSIADGRIDYADDGKASGYFGTYTFNLNTNATNTQNRVGTGDRGASVDQLRLNEVLGPATDANALLNFTMNADADIHLQFESKRDGLIPSYQADIFIGKRFGTGSSVLTFNADLAGLGDATAGAKIIAQDSSLTEDEIATLSPDWRVIRSQLTANGKEGKTQIAFQNITINVQDYLGGPLYDTLKWFDSTIKPIRPFIKFMTTPLPGTTSLSPSGIIMGALLGSPFTIFVGVINSIDQLLAQLAPYAAFTQRKGTNPRISLGGTYTGFYYGKDLKLLTDGNKERFDKYKEARQDRQDANDLKERNKVLEQSLRDAGLADDPPEDNRSRFQKFSDSVQEKATTPNKFSQKFESFRDGDMFKSDPNPKSWKDSLKNAFKKSARDALAQNDDRGGRKRVIAGINGGGFQLDALRVDTARKIFLGQNADLLRVEIPQIFVGFTYTRFFPLPAFPPIGMTIGLTFKTFIQLNFGWDTTGFYWTTKNASAQTIEQSTKRPTFGFSVTFSVGVALNLGFIEAGIQVFFEVGVEFYWNTPANSDKLRQSEIAWLNNNGLSLFDVRIYGKVGITFYVDLTIPIPLIGPITIRLIEFTFSTMIFDETIDVPSGQIQLATQMGDVLRLNTGTYAPDRLFLDTSDKNEVFRVYHVGGNSSSGEDVIVAYVAANKTYYSRYNGVKHIIGYAGKGQTVLDAGDVFNNANISLEPAPGSGTSTPFSGNLSPLQYATINFYGGSGNTVLRAGTATNAAWGRSSLVGGTGTAKLDATGLSTQGIDLIAARGNTIILGGGGADRIVSKSGSDLIRGNGGGDTFYFSPDFGRDRIYVNGTGNSVTFAGGTLGGYAAGLSDYVVASSNTGAKFQFGPLVQSAKRGLDTVYYAVDPSGTNSIDSWTGTPGADIFNVFHFSPNKTLTLNGGGGNNFYNVFLGDPLKVYNKDAALNIGRVNIDDSATGSNSRLLLTQTFADTITYDSTSVTNGRERMTLAGLERIDLDAGDSTLIWGNAASPSTYQQIVGGNINTGRIIMVGNVALTGLNDVTLNLGKTLDVAYNLVLQNAESADSRNLTINILNSNPLLTSDLYIGAAAGIYLAQGTGTTGNGYGIITLNVPTGSIANTPGETGGIIRADNGALEMRARDSIGASGDSLKVQTARISAATSSLENASGLRGIYLFSPTNLNVRASQNLDGISTANGTVRLDVASGFKLTYGTIVAGGGKDLIIIADDIELAGAYSNSRTITTTALQDVVKTTYTTTYQPRQIAYSVNYFFFSITYYRTEYYPVTTATTSTVKEWVTTTTTVTTNFPAGTGSLIGTGSLVILNQSDLLNFEVGKTTESATANTMFLTKAVLDSWQNGFGTIIIGRSKDDSTAKTGTVDVRNYAFQDKLLVRASQITLGNTNGGTDPGALSSTDTLQFDAYDLTSTTGTVEGGITFNAAGALSAQTILVNADKDLTVQGSFTSTASVDGLLQFKAGVNTGNGSVTLNGTFIASGAGSDLRAETGSTSGSIIVGSSAVFTIDDLVSLIANQGSITQSGGGRITVDNLEVIATGSITVKTRVVNLINAQILGTGNLVIDEYDSLNLTNADTLNGSIEFQVGTGTGAAGTGDLFIHTIDAGTSNVILNVAGEISELVSDPIIAGEWHVIANKLTADSMGDIDLVTKLAIVNLQALPAGSTQGNILIHNTGTSATTFTIELAEASNGLIDITTSHGLQADSVLTNTVGAGSANNTIYLETRAGGDGLMRLGTLSTAGTSVRADITLDSDGLILKKTSGTPKITGRDLFATANGNAGTGNDAINLVVDLSELNVLTTSFGEIRILTPADLTVRDMESFAGNIFITATDASSNPSLTIASINAKAKDITLVADGSILDIDAAAKILGNELFVTAGGNTTLDTGVDDLTVAVTGTGTLTVTETDSLNLVSATTTGGDVTITVGQYDSGTSTVLTSGNLFVGTLTAGTSGADDAFLTSYGGAIRTLAGAPGPKVTANLLSATSWSGIGTDSSPLNTAIQTLVASTQQAGNVVINEDDAITLDTVSVVDGSFYLDAHGTITVDQVSVLAATNDSIIDLNTDTGDITMADAASKLTAHHLIAHAPGNITAYTDIDELTATISGGTGPKLLTLVEDNALDILSAVSTYADMTFTVGGNLNVGKIDATKSFDVSLFVDGEITKTTPAPGDFNIRANRLTIESGLNGASAGGVDLVTDINTLDLVTAAPGDVIIDNLSAITLEEVTTDDGFITIDADGDMVATLVRSLSSSAANPVTLRTHDAGMGADITVNTVNAGTSGGVTLEADGIILNTGLASLVTAALLTFIANGASAGNAVALRTRATSLNGLTTDDGGVDLWETDGLVIDSLLVENGPITIEANGDVTATLLRSVTSSAANTISITLNDPTTFSSDLTVNTLDAGAAGTVLLTIEGLVKSTGGASLLTALQLTADIYGDAGTGNDAVNLRTRVDNLDLETYDTGDVTFDETGSIRLNPVIVADGDLTVDAAANITHDVVTALGHIVNLDAGASILHGSGKLSADTLNAFSVTGSTIDTVIRLLNGAVTGTGDFTLTERNSLIVSDLTTQDGDIFLTIGEYDSGTSTITSPGNLEIDLIRAGSVGTDDLTIIVYGSTFDLATGDDKITRAGYTTIDAWGYIDLTTDLDVLNGQTFAAGDVTLRESDEITVEDLQVFSGDFTFDTFGSAGDVTLTSVMVNNGSVYGNSSRDIDVVDLKAETPNEQVLLTAARDITVNILYTDSASGRVELTATGGVIDQTVGRIISDTLIAEALAGITMITDTSFLTTDITGTAGDTSVNELNSLTVVHAFTPSGLFEIIAGDRIEAFAGTTLPAVHVEATDIRLITTHGIAAAANVFNVTADTIEAEASIDGGIYIHNTKGGELKRIYAADGLVSIVFDGAMLVTDVRTGVDTDANDIFLTTTSGGIIVNYVSAGDDSGIPGVLAPSNADIFLTSAANINGTDPLLNIEAVNIMAETITLDAQTGLGDITPPLTTGRILSASTATGDMNLTNYSTNDFLLTHYSTGDGNLSFSQRGGGDLTVLSIVSLNGNIKLTVGEGATLFLYNSLSFHGNTTLTADHMEFLAGGDTVDGTGSILIQPFSPSQFVHIWSPVNGTPYSNPEMLELGPRELDAIGRFGEVYIGNTQTPNYTFMTYFPDNVMFGSPGDSSDLGGLLEELFSPAPGAGSTPDVFVATPNGYVPLSDFLLQSGPGTPDFDAPDPNLGFHDDHGFDESAFENEEGEGNAPVADASDAYRLRDEYQVAISPQTTTTTAISATAMLAVTTVGMGSGVLNRSRRLLRRLFAGK